MKLFPYQETGSRWLATRQVGLLADEMGLGKSAQAITAADAVKASKVLVLSPAVARVNWTREFEKFSRIPRPFTVVQTSKDVPPPGYSAACSYELATSRPELLQGTWDLLILDEVHFLKSVTAKRAHAVWGKEGLVRRASRVWALSGTPAPNHAGELWPLLYTFGATPLSYDDFIKKFCTSYMGPRGLTITGTNAAAVPELRKILSGIMLRRTKEDVVTELPPITYQDIFVEAGPVDLETTCFVQYVFPLDRRKELYDRIAKETKTLMGALGLTSYGSTWNGAAGGLQVLAGMSESVSTMRMYTGLEKIKAVLDLVTQELNSNAYEKIVIFAIHKDVIESLRVGLKDFGAVTLYGKTPPEKRQQNIDKFQTNPKTRVFIGNIQACGTAINLTAASNALFVEQDWVPGNNAQAAMRLHRHGQKAPVTVRFVGLANTVDEKVSRVLRRKARELIAIFDAGRLQIDRPVGIGQDVTNN